MMPSHVDRATVMQVCRRAKAKLWLPYSESIAS